MGSRPTFVEVTSDHRSWSRAKPDFDAARRIPDQFGFPGIISKTGQTNPVVRKHRKLLLHFDNPKLAQACADLIESNGPSSLNVEVIKPKSDFVLRLEHSIKRMERSKFKMSLKSATETHRLR